MARTATKKKTTVKKKSVVKVKMAKKPPAAKKPAQKSVAKSKSVLDVGSAAPSFSLPAIGSGIEGGKISSASLKGKPYVIYFYPKDDTSGCTAEACGFRDSIAAFNKLGIKLVGVSRDNLVSHEKFAKKYQLNFPLASDEQGELCASYGVWVKKSMYGRT
jgi:peroxiredoxin Q/BCP